MASTHSATPITMGNKSIIFFLSLRRGKTPANNYKKFMMVVNPVTKRLPLEKLEICAFNNHLKREFKSRLYARAICTDLRAYFLKLVLIVSNGPNENLEERK